MQTRIERTLAQTVERIAKRFSPGDFAWQRKVLGTIGRPAALEERVL